jgi:hypothetical protein
MIEMGFPPERLFTAAYGRKQPRVPGESEEADRENRRVEFVIVKKVEEGAKSGDSTQPPQPEKVGGTAP